MNKYTPHVIGSLGVLGLFLKDIISESASRTSSYVVEKFKKLFKKKKKHKKHNKKK